MQAEYSVGSENKYFYDCSHSNFGCTEPKLDVLKRNLFNCSLLILCSGVEGAKQHSVVFVRPQLTKVDKSASATHENNAVLFNSFGCPEYKPLNCSSGSF